MIRLLSLLIVFFMGTTMLFAQGELSGKVVDEKGEAIPFATITVEKEGALVTGGKTDFDGFFTIKPIAAGTYDVKVSNIGYSSYLSKGVRVGTDRNTELPTIKLKVETTNLQVVEIVEYKVPLIDKEDVGTKNTITQDEIKNLPTRNVESIASTSAGVYQSDEGGGLNVRGTRENGTAYYIDGIKVTGSNNVPPQAIEQIQVITGGVPAKYGDLTGGVVSITTRGPASKYGLSVGGITSQGMDAAGYNDVNFTLSGPIWTKYAHTDSADARIGFTISGEYLRQQDPRPSAVGVYAVNPTKLAELQQNPLVKSPIAKAFRLAAEDLRLSDLVHLKTRNNAATNNFSGAAKLDFKVTDNIVVTVGGNADYNYGHNAIERYDLLNYVNNQQSNSLSYRAFVRFTQRFSKNGNGNDKEAAKSAFQNAYYSLQADYSKVYNTYQGAQGFRPFDYGYLGKYDVFKQNIYQYGQDTLTKKFGYLFAGTQDTLVKFTPGDKNATTVNFVTKYFELAANDTDTYYRNLDQIRSLGGLLNGQRSSEVYSIWFNTGRLFNGYGVSANNDQFRLSLQGAVDIQKPGSTSRNKHSLEFGIEFEQRILRSYSISPLGLWDLMRQETNKHLTQLDKDHPILRINGRDYAYNEPHPAFGVNDTIKYNYLYQDTSQSYFDKNLRASLGKAINSLDIINVDALDPKNLNLNMFNADELLNNGSSLVGYFGYDYTGAKLTKNPSFNDFFFQKDDKGNYTRAVGAFKPIYTAGYIQDKFNFKDLLFNVGVRIDRYDANQKVLKDKYSLYKVLTVAEAQQRGLLNTVPGAMGSDYAVYVDNNDGGTPTALGYRHNDTWYNADGVEVANASIIARSSGSGRITPYLDKTLTNKIQDPNYDPSQSFEDFKPQINIMPRISFSFNVTDEALFYAHYDILTQRPADGRSRFSPTDYFFFDQNVGSAINNPNLKPEKTIDYEVGFRQKITNNAAINFSAFYRELRDNIQVKNIAYAYPRDYLTFDNIDFGTVKGFSFAFDMRRTKALPLSLKLNYSIQFAEGTGSNDASQGSLVSSGQPNLRTVAPLDYDARHTFNVTLDYHFAEGKDYNGPKIKGVAFLENFGVSLLLRGRSGTPYTAQANPTPDAKDGVASRPILAGSKNGSRLPWNFRADLKIDKSFNLTGKKKGDDRPGRSYYANIYLLIENLFDMRNILSVYHYTGNANDDGYLGSALGKQDIAGQINGASFQELYSLWSNNPANYSLPRQIRIGFDFSF